MYPRLFGILPTYDIMLGLGVIAAMVLFEIYFRKILKVKSGKVFYLEISLLIAIVVGLIGAYLFQNAYNAIEIALDPSLGPWTWKWELTFYGGLILGAGTFFLLYLLWGIKHYREGLREVLRIAPSSIVLAHALGRIGCFLAGCCYGRESDAWYAIRFETTATKVIPTNLFEAIFLFALFALLLYLVLRRRSDFGFPIYLVAYGIFRFFIEYLRDDHRGSFIPGLTPSQFWSLLLIVGGIAYFIFLFLRREKPVPAEK